GGQAVGEAHRAPGGVASTVAAVDIQALELEAGDGAVAAAHVAVSALFGAGGEFADAGNGGIELRVHRDGPRTVAVAYRLADKQLAVPDRDHRAGCRQEIGCDGGR